ncbi:hypothetical protein DB313_02065 [Borrelia turcica IST7]|uniref:Uncharacterized protein n=2 Tax=Borrelia turcica TaxID=229155 RepID=A0A386PPM6_9SPIR|nr:hypothetical protein DB313_02065 [Borrelia turcica IST7]
MFGEYSLEDKGYYSRVYFVDVNKNNFIKPGIYTRVFNEYIDYVDTYEKSLYELLKIVDYRVKELNINHLNKGRNIYLYIDDGESKDNSLDFIDFLTGNRYQVSINKVFKDVLKSSTFTISLSVEDDGVLVRDIKGIGRGNYYRKDVLDYKIREIFLFPKEDGIVFVVEKIMVDSFGNEYSRFMVEVHKY